MNIDISNGNVKIETGFFFDGLSCYISGRRGAGYVLELERHFRTASLCTVTQVHGTRIVTIGGRGIAPEKAGSIEADGLLTDVAGIPLAIKTADCLPVLFYDPVKRVAGAAHAGWKGSVGGIVEIMVKRMTDDYAVRPGDLYVLLGPSIQPCCYEVGEEVVDRVNGHSGGSASLSRIGTEKNRWCLDLKKFNTDILCRLGVKNICSVDLCTCCNAGLFYSYRRNSLIKDRMITVIAMKAVC